MQMKFPFAILKAVTEVSFIKRTVRKSLSSESMRFIVFPLARVLRSIAKNHPSCTIGPAIFNHALILVWVDKQNFNLFPLVDGPLRELGADLGAILPNKFSAVIRSTVVGQTLVLDALFQLKLFVDQQQVVFLESVYYTVFWKIKIILFFLFFVVHVLDRRVADD